MRASDTGFVPPPEPQPPASPAPGRTGHSPAPLPSLFPLVLAFMALIACFHIGSALVGKPLFRAIHLGTALEYAHGPLNLLKPIIVGYNANGAPAAQELPLWQAAVGLAFKLFGTWYGWANVVTLLLFSTGLWPLFQLARRYAGDRAAWWCLIFFLCQPLIVLMAGMASTDGFCLMLSLWFLYFADRLVREGGLTSWLAATIFGALAAVSKLPFFMAAGLCSVGLLLLNGKRGWRPWLLLALSGASAAAVFAVWWRYTDSLLAQAQFPYIQLRLSASPYTRYWFFGDWRLRLSPGPWIKGAWRFLHGTLGALPLAALLALALVRPGNRFAKLWLAASFIPVLIFTNVVLVHWHYYLMCCPAVALLCGATLAAGEARWAPALRSPWLAPSLLAIALLGSAIDGMIASKFAIHYDYFPSEVAGLLRQYSRPDDKIILYGGDWGGEELFRSGRQGVCVFQLASMPGTEGLVEMLSNTNDLAHLRAMGYTKLVLMSESRVRFAAVAVNPGSHRRRALYPQTISPEVDRWPVLYRSEDVLIKQIPSQ
ncbi:MAG TPA: glycosyltransferase family 39 protein [Verrucomicrobiae bacterium]|nr:glycosyltransferase family 39 protein [Verrucomicrobiae bacterium]